MKDKINIIIHINQNKEINKITILSTKKKNIEDNDLVIPQLLFPALASHVLHPFLPKPPLLGLSYCRMQIVIVKMHYKTCYIK